MQNIFSIRRVKGMTYTRHDKIKYIFQNRCKTFCPAFWHCIFNAKSKWGSVHYCHAFSLWRVKKGASVQMNINWQCIPIDMSHSRPEIFIFEKPLIIQIKLFSFKCCKLLWWNAFSPMPWSEWKSIKLLLNLSTEKEIYFASNVGKVI